MNSIRDQETLGRLAMQFRGTKDPSQRAAIAGEYARVVRRLIESGEWNHAPAPEDQLPDESMPPEFFAYWLH